MPFQKGHKSYHTVESRKRISDAHKRLGTKPNGAGWNKGLKGWKNSGTFKAGQYHPQWKGDNVGYSALHAWIKKKLGVPSKCEHCGTVTAKKFSWANKSHRYLRDLTDWIRLCTSCHTKYDKKIK